MARLPTLVDAIAQHDGRGRATIAHVARRLRDTSHIISSKRGAGGATMTIKDAATLLIGAYADVSPHNAPESVERAMTLQPLPDDQFDKDKRAELPSELAFLRKRTSFFETLELLIENASAVERWQRRVLTSPLFSSSPTSESEAQFSILQGARKFYRAGAANLPANAQPVRVACYAPGFAAEIHIGFEWAQLELSSPFHSYYIAPLSVRERVPQSRSASTIVLEFGLPLLLSVSRAVADA